MPSLPGQSTEAARGWGIFKQWTCSGFAYCLPLIRKSTADLLFDVIEGGDSLERFANDR
jgi:hypothetical protein